MARLSRNFSPGHCYHLISRVAHQDFMLWDAERDYMVDLLRRLSVFSGIKVLAYVIMSNHFHLLIRHDAMPAEGISQEDVLKRIAVLDGDAASNILKCELFRLARLPNGQDLACKELDKYRVRMYDVSQFMKTFKQRLTVMFNARTGHKGTMWDARFKCVQVQCAAKPLSVVAAYVDNNPVKAGLVSNAAEYPWCSFYAAEHGDESARQGYAIVHGMEDQAWPAICYQHRSTLITMHRHISNNNRSFLEGVAFGSEAYIREFYAERLPKHKSMPAMPVGGKKIWGELRFARKLSL